MLMRSNHVVPAGELRKQMVQGGSVLWHDLIQFLFQGQKEAFNSVLPRFARLDEGMPNAQGSQSFTKHDAMKHRGIVGTNRIGLAELCCRLGNFLQDRYGVGMCQSYQCQIAACSMIKYA